MIGPADRHSSLELAETLSAIAKGGFARVYTEGSLQSIVDARQGARPAFITMDGLGSSEARMHESRHSAYRERQISGHALEVSFYEQTLNVLSHFEMPSYAPDSVERLHIFIEAFRHCYKDRTKLQSREPMTRRTWSQLLSAEMPATEPGIAAARPPNSFRASFTPLQPKTLAPVFPTIGNIVDVAAPGVCHR